MAEAAELSDLILGCMLVPEAKQRWSIEEIKQHAVFEGVDWEAVQARRVPLPIDLVGLAAQRRSF